MSVSLQKGQKVSLTKAKEGLSRIVLGLGWDKVKPAKFSFFSAKPQEIDCDASALMLQNGYFVGKQDIVYFGNLTHRSGTVQHMGNKTVTTNLNKSV